MSLGLDEGPVGTEREALEVQRAILQELRGVNARLDKLGKMLAAFGQELRRADGPVARMIFGKGARGGRSA